MSERMERGACCGNCMFCCSHVVTPSVCVHPDKESIDYVDRSACCELWETMEEVEL